MKKLCSKCGIEKNTSEFRKDKSKPDGVQTFCKVCARDHHRSQYSENYSEKYKARNLARRNANVERLVAYKNNKSCLVCGEAENCCLDFHHLDPSQKDFAIGPNLTKKWDRIEAELAKCVVLCSNCHRKVHAGVIELNGAVAD